MLSGSPVVQGDSEEDGDAAEGDSDSNYTPANQNEKLKTEQRSLSWRTSYGKLENTGATNNSRREVTHFFIAPNIIFENSLIFFPV